MGAISGLVAVLIFIIGFSVILTSTPPRVGELFLEVPFSVGELLVDTTLRNPLFVALLKINFLLLFGL